MSGSRRHDENSDVLFESEVSGVEEPPDFAAVSSRHGDSPCFTEDVGDNLKEELRDVDGLGTEVEDLRAGERIRIGPIERKNKREIELT